MLLICFLHELLQGSFSAGWRVQVIYHPHTMFSAGVHNTASIYIYIFLFFLCTYRHTHCGRPPPTCLTFAVEKSGSTDVRSSSKWRSCGSWKDFKRNQKDTLQSGGASNESQGGFIQKKGGRANQVQRPSLPPCGGEACSSERQEAPVRVLALNYSR